MSRHWFKAQSWSVTVFQLRIFAGKQQNTTLAYLTKKTFCWRDRGIQRRWESRNPNQKKGQELGQTKREQGLLNNPTQESAHANIFPYPCHYSAQDSQSPRKKHWLSLAELSCPSHLESKVFSPRLRVPQSLHTVGKWLFPQRKMQCCQKGGMGAEWPQNSDDHLRDLGFKVTYI